MILVADGGSTKTTWCLISKNSSIVYADTEGYNPYFVDSDYITASIEKHLPREILDSEISELYYYGAGCFPEKLPLMHRALQTLFKKAIIQVELDLLGAARSMLGDGSGFVAILGTGSNSCLFENGTISHYIDSLGYFLGDEGSGCAMGRKLLADYARGYLPPALQQSFFESYQLSPSRVIDVVYAEPLLNRYCAGFCNFISQHIDEEPMRNIVLGCFADFFQNLVRRYPNYQSYSFNCVGSVGFVFSGLLEQSCTAFGMEFGRVIQSPVEGLAAYHARKAGFEA